MGDGEAGDFGFMKASFTVICLVGLQFAFLLGLGVAGFGGGQVSVRIEQVKVSMLGEVNPGSLLYAVWFDVVQVGEGFASGAQVIVRTDEGNATFDVRLYGKVTHCMEYVTSRPSGVSVSGVTKGADRQRGFYPFLNATNMMLTGSFATLVVTVFVALSRRGYDVLFPVRLVPWSVYMGSSMLLGGYHLVRVALVMGLLLLAGTAPSDSSSADVIEFFRFAARENPAVFFICSVLVAPVLEELLFRGFMLGRMLRGKNAWVSIGLTSLLFGIVHSGASQMVGAGFLGVVCGYVFYRTGSVLPCIGVHFLNNFIAFVSVMFMSSVASVEPSLPKLVWTSGLFFAFGLACAYRGILYLVRYSADVSNLLPWFNRLSEGMEAPAAGESDEGGGKR